MRVTACLAAAGALVPDGRQRQRHGREHTSPPPPACRRRRASRSSAMAAAPGNAAGLVATVDGHAFAAPCPTCCASAYMPHSACAPHPSQSDAARRMRAHHGRSLACCAHSPLRSGAETSGRTLMKGRTRERKRTGRALGVSEGGAPGADVLQAAAAAAPATARAAALTATHAGRSGGGCEVGCDGGSVRCECGARSRRRRAKKRPPARAPRPSDVARARRRLVRGARRGVAHAACQRGSGRRLAGRATWGAADSTTMQPRGSSAPVLRPGAHF
jgi:hypothetical protein